MSDYFGKKPNSSDKQPSNANPWQKDPFTTYDEPEAIEWPPPESARPGRPFAQPKTAAPRGARPDFTAAPAAPQETPASAGESDDFAAAGASAPTRVAPAAFSQPKAAAADEQPDGAEQTETEQTPAGRHRRAGRMSRAAAPAVSAATILPGEGQPAPAFDPFEAGDSETAAPEEPQPSLRAQDDPFAARRAAVPGHRYTGARTAMPGGVSPELRRPPAAPEVDAIPLSAQPVPPESEHGAAYPGGEGVWPPRRNEPDPEELIRQLQPRSPQGKRPASAARPAGLREPRPRGEGGPSASAQFAPRSRPSFDSGERPAQSRARYDDEAAYDQEGEGRRGGALVPVLVVLLVIGGLLAGILLPDWESMNGGLGTAMAQIKSTVVGAFDSVKELIVPTEAKVDSFSISPASATAPVELVFTVQASSSVETLRIVDQNGTEILRKTLSDAATLGGEVTKNSNGNIWTLRYTAEAAYSGAFTAQAMQKDGTFDEGLTANVVIAAPVAAQPPVTDFTADTQEAEVPAEVGFTVATSLDVTAVQVVNDYGDVVAEAYINDAGNQVLESGQTRTWSLNANMEEAYSGSFYVAYETEDDLVFTQSVFSVEMSLYEAGTMPDADGDAADDQPVVEDTPEPTDEPTATPTAVPTATPSPTPEPTATPSPTPIVTPEPTTLPILSGEADDTALPSAIKLTAKAYEGTKKQDIYTRDDKIVVNDPFQYAVWDQSGVLTFRGGPFRQNAAFGTVEIENETLTEMWKVAMEGSTGTKSGSLTGVCWPGQALIVKWPTQLRAILGINDDYKEKVALKEVMVAGQNGYLYFMDLVTGEATRDPVELGYPANGVLALQTNASPMLAIGQHVSVLSKKTIDNGLHLFNLLDNKELTLLDGRDKLMQSNYSGFNGAPLFDKNTGDMIVGGENGLLYTMETNGDFDHILGTLKISPSYQRYSWLASGQKAKSTNVDGAVAMYGSYVYFADQTGILQCVDINSLTPLWAVDTGDNTDATIALDMEDDSTVALYTGNTILNQGRKGVCTIRRYDALTGAETWAYEVPDLTYTTAAEVGCYASPVVGQNAVSDLVFFTVTNGESGATVYAFEKDTGAVRWSQALETPTVSSPVAVYNLEGDAWLLQAESDGKLHLMNAETGKIVTTLQLEGEVEASPAVYRDVLVIATTGADQSYVYGIKLE